MCDDLGAMINTYVISNSTEVDKKYYSVLTMNDDKNKKIMPND